MALRALALVLAGSLLHAQQTSPPPTTFRASVHLIVQPVTVKDGGGRPIEGLTAKDFVVTEDGRPQQIAFVEFQRLAQDPAPLQPSAPPPSSVAPVTSPDLVAVPRPGDVRYRGRRLIVLYVDLFGMPFFDQGRTFDAVRKYVTSLMTPADLVAIMSFEGRGARLRRDFTDDRDALLDAVRQLETEADERDSALGVNWDPGGAFGDDDETFNLFTADRQLAALQTAVTAFAPLPEVKTLVYFGSGLRANGAENLAQLRATVNAAVRANVTLNPIDARGLVATAPLGDATRPSPGGAGLFSGAIAQSLTTRFQSSQDTLYALAKDTGGTAAFDTNDLALGIVKAAQAVTGYYLVGYYTDNAAPDGRFRRVKVGIPGLAAEVSARPGYYAGKVFEKFNAADRERQLADALRLEDPLTEIPMALEVNYFQLNAAEYFVPVSVRMPGGELARSRGGGAIRVDVDMIGEVKDEHGVTQRNVRDKVTIPSNASGIQYETGVTLLPGRYVIKMLARNASTGRIGTFQAAFTVPNLERDREPARLATSSVVLTAQRAASAAFSVKQKVASDAVNPLVHEGRKLVPSVTRTFSARQPLFVFLEAYERDAAAMRPLAAFVAFYRNGVKVFETEPEGIAGGWNATSHAVPVRLQIPLTRLPPGRYDCQVTVLDPSAGRAAFWRAPIAVVR